MFTVKNPLLRFGAVIIIWLLIGYPKSAVAQTEWTSDVYMTLVRPSDGSSKELEEGEVELTSQWVNMEPENTMYVLLTSEGIYPDPEAFGAVYRLNPELDPTALSPEMVLLFPQVTGGQSFNEALQEGYLVALTLDVTLKRRVISQAEGLRALADDFETTHPQHFENASEKEELIGEVNSAVEFLNAVGVMIRERSRPIGYEMLKQISSEADLLESVLSKAASSSQEIANHTKETIRLVARNMQIRSVQFKGVKGSRGLPPRSPKSKFVVRTINSEDGNEIHNLRVRYMPPALYWYSKDRDDAGYSRSLTSPTEMVLPVANYIFWAESPVDSTVRSDTVSTNFIEAAVPDTIDLSIWSER